LIRALRLPEKELPLSSNSKEARDRAEARFTKEQKALREGGKARALYEAEGQAVREKTARLRALRLAKEAAEVENKPVKKPLKPKKKAAS
jgi:hypothetical protein